MRFRIGYQLHTSSPNLLRLKRFAPKLEGINGPLFGLIPFSMTVRATRRRTLGEGRAGHFWSDHSELRQIPASLILELEQNGTNRGQRVAVSD